MKIAYTTVNSVKDANSVMDITARPLCALEDKRHPSSPDEHLYCFIQTIKYACLFITINWMLDCKLPTSVDFGLASFMRSL